MVPLLVAASLTVSASKYNIENLINIVFVLSFVVKDQRAQVI